MKGEMSSKAPPLGLRVWSVSLSKDRKVEASPMAITQPAYSAACSGSRYARAAVS